LHLHATAQSWASDRRPSVECWPEGRWTSDSMPHQILFSRRLYLARPVLEVARAATKKLRATEWDIPTLCCRVVWCLPNCWSRFGAIVTKCKQGLSQFAHQTNDAVNNTFEPGKQESRR